MNERETSDPKSLRLRLPRGNWVIFDEEDWPRIKLCRWQAVPGTGGHRRRVTRFYAKHQYTRKGKKVTIAMHRLILGAERGGLVVHHRSHRRDGNIDNRKVNLVEVPITTNNADKQTIASVTSEYYGVSWHARSGKWQVHASKNHKRSFLGLFEHELDARDAYQAWFVTNHGYDPYDVPTPAVLEACEIVANMPSAYMSHDAQWAGLSIRGDVAFLPLKGGHQAIFDATHAPLLRAWQTWSPDASKNHTYVKSNGQRGGDRAQARMHAVLMREREPDRPAGFDRVDHLNRDGLDNRSDNLQWSDASSNAKNARSHRDSLSRYLGVSRRRDTGRWIAQATVGGTRYRKEFATESDAAERVDEWHRERLADPGSVLYNLPREGERRATD